MSKFYIYKMTVHDGGAPCIQGGLLSLAICKPRIRKTAEKGDIVFGFAANELDDKIPGNGLIYAARITDRVCGERYYSRKKFSNRPDCIYIWNMGSFSRRKNARFHPKKTDLTHDLGVHPEYDKAEVLLSSDFRYFRDKCPIEYKRLPSKFPRLIEVIRSLTQGERVNHPGELRKELERFRKLLWKRRSTYRSTPVPTSTCQVSCRDEGQKLTVC